MELEKIMIAPVMDAATQRMMEWIDAEHFRYRSRPGAKPEPGDVLLDSSWSLRLEAPPTPLIEQMASDFRQFCRKCFQWEFASHKAGPEIVWRLRPAPLDALNFDRSNPEAEAFTVEISEGQIVIAAHHERGLLQATHYLERLMADRGGPFLKTQTLRRAPKFMPRITNGIFITGHQSLKNPGYFSDEYLGLMSHFGANGIHLYVDLWTMFRSVTLPELNTDGLDEQIRRLRAFAARTLRHGIDVYLHINTPPLPENHPVFLAHPEVRGARVEIFIEELLGKPWNNVCSGSPKALRAYREAFENIFSGAPEVAGAMIVIGGECFYHCFTRPAPSPTGQTNCPRCSGQDPSKNVATLVNTLATALQSTGPHKLLFAWPYSAFTWSASSDPEQARWIECLDPSVSVLTNFDCGDVDEPGGGGVHFFDYNIQCIGPSRIFAAQTRKLRALKRPIFAKTETNTTPEAFFIPYLPVHHRWHARASSMARAGVAGFIGQWRFYGMNGSLPEELQYWLNWEPQDPVEGRLRTIARRDFELSEADAAAAVEAWRGLSEAWDDFPYSAMTCGERAGYMRGPFYLGPAHPLIFNPQDSYGLGPKFRLLRGDIAELASEEEIAEFQRRAAPRYVSDLLVTLPFGAERYLQRLEKCGRRWNQGLDRLRQTFGPNANRRAAMELNVCETIAIHLATLAHVARFYDLRDRLFSQPCDRARFLEAISTLQQILRDEIANAERALPILERDARIGYGHCYGVVYDAEMIRDKIRQCRHVLERELPAFSSMIRFHVWLDFP